VESKEKLSGFRLKLYEVIFEADTRTGRSFDVALLFCILASVLVIILESVETIREAWGIWLRGLEWFFTIIFTIEYLSRAGLLPAEKNTSSASLVSSIYYPFFHRTWHLFL
jgi:hypothetical protein